MFGCDHGTHPLRHFVIVFEIGPCRIEFKYSPVDIYSIQYVSPKSYSSKLSLKALVEERRNKLQDILEVALCDFKLDQVGVLL